MVVITGGADEAPAAATLSVPRSVWGGVSDHAGTFHRRIPLGLVEGYYPHLLHRAQHILRKFAVSRRALPGD